MRHKVELLFSLFFFVQLSVFSQDWEKKVTGGIETYSRTKSPGEFIDLFCFNGENYLYVHSVYGAYAAEAVTFKASSTLIERKKIVKPEGFKKTQFIGAAEVKGEVFLFFVGAGVVDGIRTQGLFAWKFNFETLQFDKISLIEEYSEKLPFSAVSMRQSENNKYLGFVVNPINVSVEYSYSLLVLNDELEKVSSAKNVEGNFNQSAQFYEFYVDNNGEADLVFKKYAQTFDRSTTFQETGNLVYIIQHAQSDNVGKTNEIILSDRKILHARLLKEESGNMMFLSWYKENSRDEVGFSLYNLQTNSEEIIYQFDPLLLEPYIECGSRVENYKYNDATERANQLSKTKVNSFIDLVTRFTHDGKDFFLLQKSTPIVVVNASQSGSIYFYLDVEGDILLVNAQDKQVKKIERFTGTIKTPRGFIVRKSEKDLVLCYYSCPESYTDKLEIGEPSLMNVDKKFDDYHLFKTVIDLNTFESSTKEVEVFSANSIPYLVSLKSAINAGDSKMTIAKSSGNYMLFELKE
jgi:hypothetical protein